MLTGNIQIVGDKLLRTLRDAPDFNRFDRSYDSKVKAGNGSFPKTVSVPTLLNDNYVTDVTDGPAPSADTMSNQNTGEVYCAVRKIGSRVTRIKDFEQKSNDIDLLTAELRDHGEQLKQRMLRDVYRVMIGGRNSDGTVMCYEPSAPSVPVGMQTANKIAWAGAAGVFGNTDVINNVELVRMLLLELGADPNVGAAVRGRKSALDDVMPLTPLSFAAAVGHMNMVREEGLFDS